MSAASSVQLKRPAWQTIIIFTLAFWLSSSLVLDLVIMPGLYASGMMAESGFATAGYLIFWIFNRIELLSAALVLTGTLALAHTQSKSEKSHSQAIILSIILMLVALVYTYALTPQMSALGLNLNLFEPAVEVPGTMNVLHSGYWVLEILKLVAGGAVIRWCYGRISD
ncbi:hypothetical protein [Microseira sp. BLCC-F43]|jgi:hypothetical protein|uniref:hypothetical protein n=1 Tax=Microseira sp. BLCC-F43 TaxID=3153602 RepID=UPI0035B6FC94